MGGYAITLFGVLCKNITYNRGKLDRRSLSLCQYLVFTELELKPAFSLVPVSHRKHHCSNCKTLTNKKNPHSLQLSQQPHYKHVKQVVMRSEHTRTLVNTTQAPVAKFVFFVLFCFFLWCTFLIMMFYRIEENVVLVFFSQTIHRSETSGKDMFPPMGYTPLKPKNLYVWHILD